MWVHLSLVLCLVTISYAQPKKKDPSVCDGAKMRQGIGYNPHPFDCTQFVQCFYYDRGLRVDPIYRNCEYGTFWNQEVMRCEQADLVDCPHDKCRRGNVPFYKHSDPNKCGAYWLCQNGKAKGECCPPGQGFHPRRGCIPMSTCKDMCPFQDRVPGCDRRPISGAPTKFDQYTDNGHWRKLNCPGHYAYNPSDCDCSIKLEQVCKPDLKIDFERGFRDVSGNGYRIMARHVRLFKGAAYFRGDSKLIVEPFRPKVDDDGTYIVKLRYREDLRRRGRGGFRGAGRGRGRMRRTRGLQALVTNGHCGKEASVVVAKIPGKVFVGAETNMSKSFYLPTVNKPWKEIIYIKDAAKLEARVCGASWKDWSVGQLRETRCGFQFGSAPGVGGYVGLIDDIEIYRCKPLEAVINVDY